jgi:voltage-dependent calcium channel L type alpha-1D
LCPDSEFKFLEESYTFNIGTSINQEQDKTMMTSTQQLYINNLKQIVTSSFFNNAILVAIILNSIAIACVDYRFVDESYQPRTDDSLRNSVIEKAEIVFTIIFAAECLLKSIAFGFVRGKEAYLRDGWNVLDFIIVMASVLNFVPGLPNFSVVRGFRVLRPLRSISRLPKLRMIINVLVSSFGELANAMVLLLFILICFSLFGVLSWSGLFHYRCRLTPFPVRLPSNCRSTADECWNDFIFDAVMNPDTHRCLSIPNDDTLWGVGLQDCVWPIDEADLRVCSDAKWGLHRCFRTTSFMGREVNITTTCGSNYDAFGHPRFIDSLEPYNSFPRMQDATFNSAIDYGLTNFDNFPSAFVTAFQIVSLEGWSAIMERVIDAWWTMPTILAFLLLIVLGGQIAINILVAVIAGAVERIESEMKKEASHSQQKQKKVTKAYADQLRPEYSVVAMTIHDLVRSNAYKNVILCVIMFNTIILSADHYGISPEGQSVLDTANFVTTVIFFLDMVLHCTAVGLKTYWSSASTCFDGVIAFVSVAELVAARVDSSGTSKSSISAFRSLRLLRLFKMMKHWTSIHHLLETIARAASEVQNFAILLILFVFIYALIGMQLFASRLHFDESGAHVAITDPNYEKSTVPRSNFDDIGHALTTVFQVLTGENWNEVMYDCWRATSWIAPVYFISLIIQGVFCCLSLFLAILIRQFDGSDLVSSNRVNRVSPENEYMDGTKESESKVRPVAFRWKRFTSIQTRVTNLVESRRFDNALTCTIVISSIILALDNPLRNPTSPMTRTLQALNMTFALVFIVEFCMKLLAHGLYKYFQELWNILDFAAVVASVLDMLNVSGGSALRLMRLLRVLRPLRMINRSPELKLVVEALLLSLPSVVNVAFVCAMFILVFAIFGVTFLKVSFLGLLIAVSLLPTCHLLTLL